MASGPSQDEIRRVNILRAKWKAANAVFQRRKSKTKELREMLAGKFPSIAGGVYDHTDAEASAIAAMYDSDQTNTNLGLRATTSLKAMACGGPWRVSSRDPGDFPDEMVGGVNSALAKVCEEGCVADEYSDAIDDVATIGPGIIRYGVGRSVVDAEFAEGMSKEIGDLVTAAANAQPGDEPVHPSPGMDLRQVAKACRDFAADEEQAILRTLEQQENLIRVAQEADEMWVEQMDRDPSGYAYDSVWFERRTYGDNVLWDPNVTTRWKDARWVGFLCTLPFAKAKSEPMWKQSARSQIKPTPVSKADGWEPLNIDGVVDLSSDDKDEIVGWFEFVEFWDRDTGEVHYFTVEGGGWEGFLERDARYPYFDANGKSVLKDWFPMRACVPIVNNLRVPERTIGEPFLLPGKDHWIQYILFDSALTACRSKAGDIIEVPDDISEDSFHDIESARPRSIIKRPALMEQGKPLITVHTFGESPIDFELAKKGALEACSRAWDMTVPEMMGTSNEPTLGQEEMAASGARTSRGGLVRKLQSWAGEIVRDIAGLVRLRYSAERMASIVGPKFTERKPVMVPGGPVDPATGEPQMVQATHPKTGEPVFAPSPWDLWKASSLCGDRFEVTFAPISRENDLMRMTSADNFVAMVGQQVNPITQLPYFDTRKIIESEWKLRGFGDPVEFKPSADDLKMAQEMAGATAAPAEGGGESGRETPGGGRSDSRIRGGGRGPQPIPGQKSRANGSDVGDQSTRAHRVGTLSKS